MSKHVPPPTGEPLESVSHGLAKQEADRVEALQRLRGLRKETADEIDRLLDFLDESDIDPDLEPTLGFMNGPAEMDECETPEDDEPSLASLDSVANQTKWAEADGSMMDAELDDSDDEPDVDGEPSLGSLSSHGHGDQSVWGRPGEGGIDAEDEHDGAEPDEADSEPSAGFDVGEPSLGWTVDGLTTGSRDDREEGSPAAPPQNRTRTNRKPLTVEVTYRRFLRGLDPNQRAAMQDRMRDDSGVSLVGGPAWGEKSEV
jgi:hypothetical protein